MDLVIQKMGCQGIQIPEDKKEGGILNQAPALLSIQPFSGNGKDKCHHGKEKKHKIEQTKIQQRILSLKEEETATQIKLQVAQALFELEAAVSKDKLATQGISSTEKLLAMTKRKYENNDVLYIEVLKVQNDHMIGQLTSRLAQFDVWLKKSALDKVSGL